MRRSVTQITAGFLICSSTAALAQTWKQTADGVIVSPANGSEKVVRLQVYGDGIIRVTSAPTANIPAAGSLMVVARPLSNGFTVSDAQGHVTLTTPKASADVDLATGNVSFRDASGKAVLVESGPPAFADTSAEGQPFLSVTQQFNRGTDEGFYGLGQHQNRQMNYNGEDVELAQHNMDVAIPFVVSTRNYGLLWDNNSITRFGNPKPYAFVGQELKVTGEGGQPGFTAHYFLGDREVVTRQEPAIDYQYIEDQSKWPAEAKAQTTAATSGQNTAGNAVGKQRVVWTGTIHPTASGTHKFRLYSSSYVKVFVDGKEVLQRWRQNWNPWYHNYDLPLVADKPADVRVEWEPNAGYIALLHSDPLPDADRHSLTLSSEVGKALDYYFIAGDSMDGVISGYRTLTGKAPILPKWAYGFWQSRQRYNTQDELLGVVREYRKRGLPLDNIVQDWFYWPEDSWGCHCFDPKRFPNPQAMVDDVHRANANIMISVWAKFYPTTDHYKELDAVDGIYRRMVTPPADATPDFIKANFRDWVGPGYASAFYDPYNRKAKDIYSRQMIDSLGVKNFDAWWLDSDEPDFHSNLSIEERQRRMGPTAVGPGAAFFNSFPRVHVDGVYSNLVRFKPDVRPFILTRSAFGGIQRDSAAVWSGDVASRWDDLRDQVSAGVNFSMSGVPNWTHDIGGFANEERYTKQDPAHLAEWLELNTRWFQFGAFSPLFRSHGEPPFREIYELAPTGTPTYRSMEWYDRLRYRLMPYIYTLAADTHFNDGSIMRGLVMDFGDDRKAWDVDDEYLFGPAFLVAPVTEFKVRERKVYLPANTKWFDLYSGRSFEGGQSVTASAPYERMPIFVRAGSIVPVGPAIQHTKEGQNGAISLQIYAGADGSFSLYEDDGVSHQYLNGAFSRIPIRYDDASGTLTIGTREGGYPGMSANRTIRVRLIQPGRARALDLDQADKTVAYDGSSKIVRLRD
ncbi:glycoside hydrolase family 31 protein [Sphingomonas daechungensis]|uniref:glycoside hydrolase family 31 protein n=1 Tax=Sphingomonas daechungensis TaxID=1176646 RepID=UPI0031EA2784